MSAAQDGERQPRQLLSGSASHGTDSLPGYRTPPEVFPDTPVNTPVWTSEVAPCIPAPMPLRASISDALTAESGSVPAPGSISAESIGRIPSAFYTNGVDTLDALSTPATEDMAGPITVDESFDASAELRLDTLTDGSSRSIWPTALTEQAPAVLDLEDNPCFQEALGEAIADVEAAKAAESMHLDADECDTAKVLDILREQLSLAKSLQVEGTLFQIEQYRVLCWAYKAQTKLLIGIRRAYEQLELTEEQKLRRHGIATNWFEQEENIYGMAVLLKNQSLHNLCEYYLGFRPGKPRLPTPHVSKL